MSRPELFFKLIFTLMALCQVAYVGTAMAAQEQRPMPGKSTVSFKYLEQPELHQAAMDWLRTPWTDLPAEIKKQCGL